MATALCFPVLWWLVIPVSGLLSFVIRNSRAANHPWRTGFLYGVSFYIPLTSWLIHARRLLPNLPAAGIFIFLGIILLGLWQGLFFALAFYPFQKKWMPAFAEIPLFAAFYTMAEWVQESNFLFPFGWGKLSLALTECLPLAGAASWLGGAGLTFFIALTGGYLAELFYLCFELLLFKVRLHQKKIVSYFSVFSCKKQIFSYVGAITAIVGGQFLLGKIPPFSIEPVNPAENQSKAINVAMVQTNYPGAEKWNVSAKTLLSDLFTVSHEKIEPQSERQWILWPETALPFDPADSPVLTNRLKDLAAQKNAVLLTGMIRRKNGVSYNSMAAISSDHPFMEIYDKQILVPFGEYIPFQGLLKLLQDVTGFRISDLSGLLEFEPGNRGSPLKIEDFQVGGVLCYESVFSRIGREQALGSDFLAILSNDSWFGDAPAALWQIHANAVLRAVENQKWVFRCGNAMLTEIISPQGNVVASAPVHTLTTLQTRISLNPSANSVSFYTVFGESWLAGGVPFWLYGSFFVISGKFQRRGKLSVPGKNAEPVMNLL